MGLEITADSEDEGNDFPLKVTDRFLEEVERLEKVTSFNGKKQLGKGYTLLRIVVDTYENGGEVYRKNASGEEERILIPGYNDSDF